MLKIGDLLIVIQYKYTAGQLSIIFLFGCFHATNQFLWLQKTVSEITGYLATAIERPTY